MKEDWNKQQKAMLWTAVAILAFGNIAAVWRIGQAQDKLDEMEQVISAQVNSLQERADDLSVRADAQDVILRSEVKATRELAAEATNKAGQSAERKASQVLNKMAVDYKQHRSQIDSELGQVKNQALRTNQQVSGVIDQVTEVQGDVAETKSELETARSQLRQMYGDLGLQSGLIATNSSELQTLRKLGERHYYEFVVPKDGEIHRVGHVGVKLRKTKTKQGKFTLDLIADDVRTEKKDRTVNEPIQFYVSGHRQPCELVVNKVMDKQIAGYLSVPKVVTALRK